MKKRLSLIIILLLFAGDISFAENGPRISFTSDHYNFGNVLQGKTVEHTFLFENKGTEDLWIKEVTTSCGCTAALVSSNTVKPGEKGEIRVSYDSQGRAGKVSRTITIVSNDPVEPVKELAIEAIVAPSMHTTFNVNESLFSDKCGACHFIPADQKKGKDLYDAVCAFCHGRTAQGLDMLREMDTDVMNERIRDGIKGTEMPAWIKEQGGPLDEGQIRSLSNYIKGVPDFLLDKR
ncbi:MAG: DUF1573 domain-containing protein [Nitrospirae bacterium]|nr:DUF1573 domain-containing protein [Nitrospirota bacterium]